GLEEKLKEKSLLVREERVLAVVSERVEPLRILHRDFVDIVPLDTAFTSPKALQGLPNADLLAELGTILDRASVEVESLAQQFAGILRHLAKINCPFTSLAEWCNSIRRGTYPASWRGSPSAAW